MILLIKGVSLLTRSVRLSVPKERCIIGSRSNNRPALLNYKKNLTTDFFPNWDFFAEQKVNREAKLRLRGGGAQRLVVSGKKPKR
jgi:hypothetical protein